MFVYAVCTDSKTFYSYSKHGFNTINAHEQQLWHGTHVRIYSNSQLKTANRRGSRITFGRFIFDGWQQKLTQLDAITERLQILCDVWKQKAERNVYLRRKESRKWTKMVHKLRILV